MFTPTKLGACSLTHRVVLAPMTRLRTIQKHDADFPAYQSNSLAQAPL
ncbi:hypothetical protein [Paraburkholderia sp. HD33-4]|nr:hypothetical protein [Paraburkholderia sp. HD33-4]